MTIVLHLDDDPLMLVKTKNALSASDLVAACSYRPVKNEAEFWKAFDERRPDCILLDIVVDDKDEAGLQLLQKLRSEKNFKNPVLMMSSVADSELIKKSVRLGATDFITKGMDETELAFRVSQSIERASSAQNVAREMMSHFAGDTMRSIFLKMPRIINAPVKSVLVTGESGTGKEVVAECLRAALKPATPFVPVNCAAIAKDLMESELFGHEKGAFTGAQAAKQGLFSSADGGWIFLDEVARLSLPCQAALLRTLESGEIRPVGSNAVKNVNVRILAATNEDLDDMVEKGEFRGDLLQRLRSYEVFLPPLRERGSEVSEILDALLMRLSEQSKGINIRLAPAVRKLFLSHKWKKGNIRELWQVLQAASVEADDGLITVSCLPRSFVAAESKESEKRSTQASAHAAAQVQFPVEYTELEEKLFLEVLEALAISAPHQFVSQRKVAEQLGISRHTLCAKLDKIAATKPLSEKFAHLLSGKKESDSV